MYTLNDIVVKQELRSNWHLRDIINNTHAEVTFPSEVDVEYELALKRLYSVHGYNPLTHPVRGFESI